LWPIGNYYPWIPEKGVGSHGLLFWGWFGDEDQVLP
jgi:hypothetical protein